jgi:hypothetical protein
MRKAGLLALLALIAALTACSQDNTILNPPGVGPIDPENPDAPPPVLSAVTLVSSSNQIQSDGALPVTITARVVDESNIAVSGVPVSFSADSGVLTINQATTDAGGRALASLSTEGNPANRIINVQASAVSANGDTLSSNVTVTVIGTELTVTGPTTLVLGDSAVYTFILTDANDNGIFGETLTVTSALGNDIAFTSLDTDAGGQVQVTLTATNAGTETLTVSGLGIEAQQAINISNDSFAFITPAPSTEIPLNTDQEFRVRWTQAGTPVNGQPIDFSTTRGTFTGPITDLTANGEAATTISSSNAGTATVSASNLNGPSTQLTVEFVATVPDNITVQADPFNIAPNEQSTITAVVRDAAGNLVKNRTVVFELDDVTGGSLSVGSAVTDSQGRAQTFYRASSSTSANEGVTITARVTGTALEDSVSLSVARRELFFTFGTGNTLEEPNAAAYSLPFLVQATDADGNGVAGVSVELSILTARYLKGYWIGDTVAQRWFNVANITCDEEDQNRNGQLDPGEDINNNGRIDVGNNATIVPGVAVTDENGAVLVSIDYAQQFATWLQVVVEAKTEVQGTEFVETQSFVLPVLGSDVTNINVSPPGNAVPTDRANGYPNSDEQLDAPFILGPVSPFGYAPSCFLDI